jgi:hypothetical protein
MLIYNILWVIIFSIGGITLGLFGLTDPRYFYLIVVNPAILNQLLYRTSEIQVFFSSSKFEPVYIMNRPVYLHA